MSLISYYNRGFNKNNLVSSYKLHPLIVKLPGPSVQHFAINRSNSSFEQAMVSSRPKCNSDELNKLLK